ncbi:MAG: efflux RND transporter permease subunit [Eubacteriales bacterium]
MLTKFSVRRPVTILMIILIVILIGVVSLTELPIDLLPNIEFPIAVVSTSYSGVSPEEIENLITRPLENSLTTVENIDTLTSISSEGSSLILLQLEFGTDMDFAALEMREKIDMVKGFLPDGASDPRVFKFDPTAMPVMYLTVSSEGNITTTQKIAEDIIKTRLERIQGVASVEIGGGFDQEVQVELDQNKIQGFNLTLDYISQILMSDNINLPGGEVFKGNQELNVRTIGEYDSLQQIKNANIPLQTGGSVRLGDIANVSLTNSDKDIISRLNGEDTIEITIMKQSGVNTVNVSNEISEELANLQREYQNVTISQVFNQADYINFAIGNMARNAIFGGGLAILVLLLFLKNFKSTLIIGLSMPISIISTFILVYFADVTLNMMTLGGIALGIGMLVDNSIVVLENIYRYRTEGYGVKESSILGANEVAAAVTASTLTTIAVFLPIVFVEGITSTIFKELAMTVTFSLISSLAVALTLIPMLSANILKIKNIKIDVDKEETGAIEEKGFINRFRRGYKRILNSSLNHRLLVFILILAMFVGSAASLGSVGSAFLPASDEGQVDISVSLPNGSELDETDAVVSEIEEILKGVEEIDYVYSSVGGGGMSMGMGGSNTNSANIMVMLKNLDEREKSSFQLADEIRTMVTDVPGAEIGVSATSFMMGAGGLAGGGLSISIKGDDIDTLEVISNDFKEVVENIPGTREVETSISEGVPEVRVRIDKDRASRYGLTTGQIANSVRNTLSGRNVTTFKYENEELDVVIKGDERYKESVSALKALPLTGPTGAVIPLEQVAEVYMDRGPISIQRENQSRVVSVSADTFGRDIASVSADIEEKLADYEMPQGYTYSLGGEIELIEDAFDDLTLVLLLAILLVYMILAAQFESLMYPFIIMFTVPLALSGGFLGLAITGVDISIVSIIGFIVLVGIVVNNAIVLVDYINKRRDMGETRREAILNAGPIRLRPILMTALTTILALVPLAVVGGEGSEIQLPMAVVVIGGLTVSTILTLVFVPVMYTVIDDIAHFFKKLFGMLDEEDEVATDEV